jgi:hypothetical protein
MRHVFMRVLRIVGEESVPRRGPNEELKFEELPPSLWLISTMIIGAAHRIHTMRNRLKSTPR